MEAWRSLLHVLSVEQVVTVELAWSAASRHFHCQFYRLSRERSGYSRDFLGEGFAGHPLGAVRQCLAALNEPLHGRVRSLLLEALIVWWRDDLEAR